MPVCGVRIALESGWNSSESLIQYSTGSCLMNLPDTRFAYMKASRERALL